jgi:hypothetical protein
MLPYAAVILALLAAVSAPQESRPAAAASARSQTTLAKILSDPALWGRDFTAALRGVPAFEEAGEKTVVVLPSEVRGAKRYPSAAAAAGAVAVATTRMSAMRRATMAISLPQEAVQLPDPQPMRVKEDRDVHLASAAPQMQLLAPALTMTVVQSRLGPPEAVRRVAIDDGTERKPRILQLHSYDKGNVVFATVVGAPNPKAVDRVLLDASALRKTLF